MRVIEEMGMTLNPSRAAAIVTFRGSQRAQATAHCLLNKGGHRLLGVGTGRERIFIPVTQTTKYLGAQISYGDFETATLKHRLQQGRVRYWQLVSILNSKQSMTLQHRIALWKCVIWPTLSYGLGGSGLSAANLKTLQSTVMKQLRAIAGSQSHVTRESDRTLLDRLDVQSPCDALRHHVTKTGRHGADGFVFSWEHAWKVHLRDCFDGAKHGLDAVPTAVSATACPTCGLYFSRAMKVLGYIEEGEPLKQVPLPKRNATIYVNSHFYLDDLPQSTEPLDENPRPHSSLAAQIEEDCVTGDEGYGGRPFPQLRGPDFMGPGPDTEDDSGADSAFRRDGFDAQRPPQASSSVSGRLGGGADRRDHAALGGRRRGGGGLRSGGGRGGALAALAAPELALPAAAAGLVRGAQAGAAAYPVKHFIGRGVGAAGSAAVNASSGAQLRIVNGTSRTAPCAASATTPTRCSPETGPDRRRAPISGR